MIQSNMPLLRNHCDNHQYITEISCHCIMTADKSGGYNGNRSSAVTILFIVYAIALAMNPLTHWGRVMHICDSNLSIIGSDNGLSPGRRQDIIWTNAGILLIGPLKTHFSEILIEILTFSFKKMRLKVSSAKRRPFCLGLNVLTHWGLSDAYGHQ